MKLGLVFAALFAGALGLTAQISPEPVLRIEVGYHAGTIQALDGDAQDRYLVTGSGDKTVRLWDAHTGELLHVYRPPIGPGNDGRIDAVAISPDGRTVAAGGWTGSVAEGMSIYLFDRDTGRLVHRVGGLPELIHQLRYSPDGRFLVAGLGARNGIRLYRTPDYALVSEDRDYGNNVTGADFTPGASPSLVTAALDGSLRLYRVAPQGSLSLERKTDFPAGSRPVHVQYSPDGSRLAVTLLDTPDVIVLRSADLSRICGADTSGLNRSLEAVAWSSDGQSLYAGGTFARDRKSPIFAWSGAGCGARTEISGAANAIRGLHSMRDGGLAFATAYPIIGMLNSRGERTLLWGPPEDASFVGPGDLFVSADGQAACIGKPSGNRPNCLSITDRNLTARSDPMAGGLRPPDTRSLSISDWELAAPKLNGSLLDIGPDKRSRCLAIAPNRREFILATDLRLELFDSSGRKRWELRLPDAPGAINVSGDGRLAIALLADGTIRWYAMDNGRELLDLFGLARRWVLWAPSGYYDASPGGEDLIGWNISTSRDAASDFYPASRFRSTFYRPDVVATMLKTMSETESLRLANAAGGRRPGDVTIGQALPPLVSLLSPSDQSDFSASEVTLRYSIRTPSGEPVTNVRVLVDGRPLLGAKRIVPIGAGEAASELKVQVPSGNCTVSLIVENRFASSEPASVRLRWRGVATATATKPKLYVLAIGISDYPSPNSLQFAAKDARDVAAIMQAQRGRLYSDVEVRLVTDAQATRDRIIDSFDWLEKSVTQRDSAFILLSGHGVNDNRDNYYFLPVNFDENALRRTAVAFSDIRSTVQNLPGKVVLLVDSCHSGNVLGGHSDPNGFVNELSSPESGVVVFAASTGNQVALEQTELGNGIFTKAFLEGIGGAADYTHKGTITVTMLDLYLSQRVTELTQGRQTPTTAKPHTIADFPVALLR